ncbi:MAG: hypothetical protein WBP93_06120 [Pyrinomonadaceae bacterium]
MRVLSRIILSLACAAMAVLFLGYGESVMAQQAAPQKEEQKVVREVVIERNGEVISHNIEGPPPGMMLGGGPGQDFTFNFVTSEMSFDMKVVKGAPYSAEAVTESVRTLADGNRIVHKSNANVYRDSEGRTRRDQTISIVGPYAAAGDPPKTFFINDPVAGVNYVLDPRSKVARKMENLLRGSKEFHLAPMGPMPPMPPPGAGIQAVPPSDGERPRVMIYENRPDGMSVQKIPGPGKERQMPKRESLGTQTIEGVSCEGTRTTMTIPAGEIGNERAIEIVSERWYSPELQTVVMSKRNDPLGAGETTYRLTNINRSEPARSLFEVPADYKIKEGPPKFEFKMMKPGEDK